MTAKCYIAFLYHVVRCTREYLKSNYPGEEGHPLLMLHVRAPGHLKAGVVEACAAKLGVQLAKTLVYASPGRRTVVRLERPVRSRT